MALITNDIQNKLAKLLVEEGLVRTEVVESAIKESSEAGQSLIAYMVEHNILDSEILVHAISHVSVLLM